MQAGAHARGGVYAGCRSGNGADGAPGSASTCSGFLARPGQPPAFPLSLARGGQNNASQKATKTVHALQASRGTRSPIRRDLRFSAAAAHTASGARLPHNRHGRGCRAPLEPARAVPASRCPPAAAPRRCWRSPASPRASCGTSTTARSATKRWVGAGVARRCRGCGARHGAARARPAARRAGHEAGSHPGRDHVRPQDAGAAGGRCRWRCQQRRQVKEHTHPGQAAPRVGWRQPRS
jgi:hypothetical protein